MNIIFTVLVAFPIGLLVKQRGLAIVTYLAVDAILFTFQTVGVLLSWLGPDQGRDGMGFGPKPTGLPTVYSNSEYFAYGVVNLVIIVVGVALTILGTYVARRRAAKRVAVSVG